MFDTLSLLLFHGESRILDENIRIKLNIMPNFNKYETKANTAYGDIARNVENNKCKIKKVKLLAKTNVHGIFIVDHIVLNKGEL